ncbi:4Fe-4S ferredoxin, iron-sulpur binding domain-containing protein [Desulfovibrio sp. X2]|uniref:4Fe-4S dicluster domain-containing protein n=1 Tax=Desulfovibrio sp. X2 TaxID=941449 RepID=UPI000358EF59|nr:4Fe-4S dicluster domain-containing protein [Desulfovibrio sp. X2]EPR44018.1 4Fe-4S ferredoxin, iron-sulpur binding domain-containing protein [Desulfovibrio sp. X2]
MSRIVIREERCKGCLLCTTACPKGLIVQSERFNAMGYKVAEVPEGKMSECTGCASCAKLCPDCCITVYKTVKEAAKKEKK